MLGDGLKAQDANRSVRLRGSRGCCPVNLPDRKCTLTPRDQNATRRPCLPPTSLMTHSRKTRAAGCWKWKAEGTYKPLRSQRDAEKKRSLGKKMKKRHLLRSAIPHPRSVIPTKKMAAHARAQVAMKNSIRSGITLRLRRLGAFGMACLVQLARPRSTQARVQK